MLISVEPSQPEVWQLLEAVQILREGGVIAYPTDTVYGIGCDIFNKKAIEKIYWIKKMPRKKPLSFICHDLTNISEYAKVSNVAYRLIKRLVPGPYTFILPATHNVPRLVLANQRTIGIRIPDNPICSQIVELLGNPIISTSLSPNDDEYISEPIKIFDDYGSQLDAVIDGGILKSELSTIIDLTENSPKLVRLGKGDISSIF